MLGLNLTSHPARQLPPLPNLSYKLLGQVETLERGRQGEWSVASASGTETGRKAPTEGVLTLAAASAGPGTARCGFKLLQMTWTTLPQFVIILPG